MSEPLDEPEAMLCSAYAAQADLYAAALAALHRPAGSPGAGTMDECATALLLALDQVTALEARIAQTKQEWQRQARQAGPALRQAMALVHDRLLQLSAAVDQSIRDLEASQQTMLPRLDQFARLQQMHRAYGRFSTRPDAHTPPVG